MADRDLSTFHVANILAMIRERLMDLEKEEYCNESISYWSARRRVNLMDLLMVFSKAI